MIAAQPFRGVRCRQLVRGDIVHIHRREVCDACMDKRFVHRQVCIMHGDIFADQRDMHFLRRRVIAGDHVRPLGQIRRGIVKLQRFQHHARQPLFFQIQRHFKQRGRIPVLHDVAHRHQWSSPAGLAHPVEPTASPSSRRRVESYPASRPALQRVVKNTSWGALHFDALCGRLVLCRKMVH